MVGRVDQVLKSDFGRPDGLADAGVYVLDPCCGTGAYLVEVLNTIATTLADQGEGALLAGRLKQAAMDRVFGFEILPAPFVVRIATRPVPPATWHRPGRTHPRAGSRFPDQRLDRLAAADRAKQFLLFPEMEEERDKAERVKQHYPILVVLGNPPYNGFAGVPVEEEAGLVEPYRTTKTHQSHRARG